MEKMTKEQLLELLKNNGYSISEEVHFGVSHLFELLDAQGNDDITAPLKWLEEKRAAYQVNTEEIGINNLDKWQIDSNTGNIAHESGKFFTITGVRISGAKGREVLSWTQPMIKQNECGILGIICKRINGVMHYLLYAKYEPGNVPNLQLSPTLQATASNLKQAHGGKKPMFSEYFEDGGRGKVLVSVVEVEDGGRFYLKTNRCMIVEVDESINAPDDYIWLTMPQIKKFLKMDNMVNSLTRCVFGSR